MLFIHVGHNPQLRAQYNLRRVLEYNLDHFIAETEENRMLFSSPFLNVDMVLTALHDVALVIFLLFLVIIEVGTEVLEECDLLLQFGGVVV